MRENAQRSRGGLERTQRRCGRLAYIGGGCRCLVVNDQEVIFLGHFFPVLATLDVAQMLADRMVEVTLRFEDISNGVEEHLKVFGLNELG